MVGGFRERAERVNGLLAAEGTTFLIVCGPAGRADRGGRLPAREARRGRPAARRGRRQPRPRRRGPRAAAEDVDDGAGAQPLEDADLADRIVASAAAAAALWPSGTRRTSSGLATRIGRRTADPRSRAERRGPRPRRAARASTRYLFGERREPRARRLRGRGDLLPTVQLVSVRGNRYCDPRLDLLAVHRRARELVEVRRSGPGSPSSRRPRPRRASRDAVDGARRPKSGLGLRRPRSGSSSRRRTHVGVASARSGSARRRTRRSSSCSSRVARMLLRLTRISSASAISKSCSAAPRPRARLGPRRLGRLARLGLDRLDVPLGRARRRSPRALAEGEALGQQRLVGGGAEVAAELAGDAAAQDRPQQLLDLGGDLRGAGGPSAPSRLAAPELALERDRLLDDAAWRRSRSLGVLGQRGDAHRQARRPRGPRPRAGSGAPAGGR